MSIRKLQISVTTGATGWGTAIAKHPIAGEIRQVLIGSNFGTAHVSLGTSETAGTAVPTNGFFHGAGTVLMGMGAPLYGGQGSRYKTFPVVAGDHIRAIVSGPGYATAYSKTDKITVIYDD